MRSNPPRSAKLDYARRWRQDRGLLRTGAETDGASVTFSEMLPAPEQSWLAAAAAGFSDR